MAQASVDLIEAARDIIEERHPITVRGVCYGLFVAGVIDSMSIANTKRVSRLLTIAREQGTIEWDMIVDETREVERPSSWSDPAAYVRAVRRSYRRDFWDQQPHRVEVWAEKGTVRGVLAPVLNEYGVGFRVMHGFGSATSVYGAAQDGYDDHPLVALYCGDHDPSGLYMSEVDLPARLERYGGDNVILVRIALLPGDLATLPSFPADSKSTDARYRWYVQNHGPRCWELDAMSPVDLRARVGSNIESWIEPEAWARCERAQEAEQESLQALLDRWSMQ